MKKIFLFIFALFFISLISAVPPVTQVTAFPEGYSIQGTPQQVLEQNKDFQYNFFLFNTTTGFAMDNSSGRYCIFYMANKSGGVILYQNVTYFQQGFWGLDIKGGNFSQIGEYAYGVKCLGTKAGGTHVGIFEVTPKGYIYSTSQGLTSIVILLSIISIMFFFSILGFKLMDYENLYGVSMFFILISIIIAVFGMYLGVMYSSDLLYSATSAPYSKLFYGVIYSLVGMTFFGLLIIILKAVDELKERKSLQRYGEGYNTKTKQYDY